MASSSITMSNPQSASTAADDMLWSAYELCRLVRIKQNQAMLDSLGLGASSSNNAVACKNDLTASSTKSMSKSSPATRTRATQVSSGSDSASATTVSSSHPSGLVKRASKRLRGISATNDGDKNFSIKAEPSDDVRALEQTPQTGSRIPTRSTNASAIQNEEDEHAQKAIIYEALLKLHTETGVKLPSRASYKHTVMRVMSMSEKALNGRICRIEKAAGVYAVVKMRIFAEVLIIEGYYELAKAAHEALNRLLCLPQFNTIECKEELKEMVIKTESGAGVVCCNEPEIKLEPIATKTETETKSKTKTTTPTLITTTPLTNTCVDVECGKTQSDRVYDIASEQGQPLIKRLIAKKTKRKRKVKEFE